MLVVRCQNGTVLWGKQAIGLRSLKWVCGDDGFSVTAPNTLGEAKIALLAIATHSVQLAGPILQVAQVEL